MYALKICVDLFRYGQIPYCGQPALRVFSVARPLLKLENTLKTQIFILYLPYPAIKINLSREDVFSYFSPC